MSEEEKKAKKPAAKKPARKQEAAAKKPAAEKKPEKAEEKPPVVEEEPSAAEAPPEEKELSEEELRRLIEEQMEKITIKDILGRFMMELASLAYQKMGIPENVNLKYKDFSQARMAIDALKGLVGALEGKVPDEEVNAYRGTLANLQMNYARLAGQAGKD